MLRRINGELGGHFDLDRFRHVARWNEEASRIETRFDLDTTFFDDLRRFAVHLARAS